jgi:hypothetical protein
MGYLHDLATGEEGRRVKRERMRAVRLSVDMNMMPMIMIII